MRISILTLTVLLASHSYAQEFSRPPAETAELTKLIRAYQITASEAMRQAGSALMEAPADREAYAQIMKHLSKGSEGAHFRIAVFFGAPNRGNRDAADVESAKNLSGWLQKLTKAIELGESITQTSKRDRLLRSITQAVELLESFDTSLPYTSYLPIDAPSIIFPHGDYLRSQLNFARTGRYGTGHINWDIANLLHPDTSPVFPVAASTDPPTGPPSCGRLVSHSSDSWDLFIRAWALGGGIELAEDASVIDAEHEASGKTRPRSFFVSERQFELLLNRNPNGQNNTTTTGRRATTGMPGHIAAMTTNYIDCQSAISAVNVPTWSRDCWSALPRNDSFSRDPIGQCTNFVEDLADFWKDTPDGWAFSNLGRFHGPFGPPPTDNGDDCPTPEIDFMRTGESEAILRCVLQ